MNNHYGKNALKASLIHFLFGKALNAAISLSMIILLVRWIEPAEYGVYVALLALQASFLALSSLGVETTAERFLPELRTKYHDNELLGFVITSFIARFVSLIMLVIVAALASSPMAKFIGLEQYISPFRWWMLVIALTGLFSFAMTMLDSMLHQRHAQISMSCYLVVKFVLILLTYYYYQLNLALLVDIEIASTGFALLIASWLLFSKFSFSGLQSGWQIVKNNSNRLGKFAFFNYVAQVVFQFFNAEIMKLLVVKLLGLIQSARYGFAFSLVETVQRYLPAVLLLKLIKPVFVSRFTKTGNFSELNEMASIILKLNLLMLVPLIVFAIEYGYDFLSMLSDGKYVDAHWIFVGALVLLIPSSHQLVLSILASTVEKNAMQLYSGLASTIAFPCALFFIPHLGAVGAVAASAVSAVVYNICATTYLRRAGFDYKPDVRAAAVFLIAGFVMYGLALVTHETTSIWWVNAILTFLLSGSGYFVIVRVLSAFNQRERALMNSILPKPIFIW